jgi:hypothetical protein
MKRSFARRVLGVLRTPGLVVCAAAAAWALPSRSDVARECVAASVHVRPAACAVSDLDGDRQADYVFAPGLIGPSARLAQISVHLSSAPEAYQLLLPDGVVASSFIFRDVDGDGRPDIALLGGFNETVGVFLNDGSGRFEFDHQSRYLTAPSRDFSEIATPPGSPLCDCAELSSGSYCAVCSHAGAAYELPAGSSSIAESRPTLTRRSRGVVRSRAP